MSYHVVSRVIDECPIKGPRRLVMMVLAHHAQDDGTTWPSQLTLARETACTERGIQKMVDGLVSAGELDMIRAGGGRGTSAVYRLTKYIRKDEPSVPPLDEKGRTASSPFKHGERANGSTGKGEREDERANGEAIKGEQAVPPNDRNDHKNDIKGTKVVWPVELNSDAFKTAWNIWEQYRRERKISAYTPTGTNMQFGKLKKLGEVRAIAAIEHSIAQNYQGIYEDKNGHAKTHSGTPAASPHNNNLNRDAVSDYRQIRKRVPVGLDPNGQGNPKGNGGTPGHVS